MEHSPQDIRGYTDIFTLCDLMSTIVTRQIRFVGHIVRKGKLEYMFLTGREEGKGSSAIDISWFVRTIDRIQTTGPHQNYAKT